MNEFAHCSRFVRLACYVSVTALAIGCAVPQARAQMAFQGNPSIVSGSANITRGTTDTIELNTAQTIINWTPTDTSGTGEIDFLPNGTTALFRNNPNVSTLTDFTVLNRILPVDGSGASVSRVVALNGAVQSQLFGSAGGSVWFYSPGGIVAGPTSVFNVGSLVLTSNDIDATGGLYGSKGEIRFRGAAGSASAVEVKPGATIDATGLSGSYVALVAPRVVQGGTVKVDGSVAYVGAEQADILINGGLFDISISAGTSDANGVVHTGTTERQSSTVSSIAQNVYMVAVPKNNALTMLLSGNVGYDAANSAVQSGSAVVLSAGYDVASSGGFIDLTPNATATGQGNFAIGAGSWQPDVTGAATGAITLRADQGEAINAAGNVNLTAGNGGTGGRIDLLTFGGSGSPSGNGQINVAGTLTLDVSGFVDSGFSAPPLVGGDATGGAINIVATGGSISAGSLSAYAGASGGAGTDRSGDATGGSITLSALTVAGPSGTEAGSLSFGTMSLEAWASAGYSVSTPIQGGNAVGGTVNVAATGGSISAGDIYVDVGGSGGDASDVAGTGRGGSVTLSSSAAGGLRGNLAISGCTSFGCGIHASGSGGYGLNGANGTGGSILLYASDADFSVGGDLYLHAGGVGGGAQSGDGTAGRGGDGIGGSVSVESRAGSGVMSFGGLHLTANGSSALSTDGIFFNDGDGGNGTGGSVNLLVAGGTLTATSLDATASGGGGNADYNCPSLCEGNGSTAFLAGTGRGGTAQFVIIGGSADVGALTLTAEGTGGLATGEDVPGNVSSLTGQGFGGTALLQSQGGVLRASAITVDASGVGGSGYDNIFQADGPDGGSGTGGTARLLMDVGGTGQVIVDTDVIVRALGKGGFGSSTGSDGPGFYRAGVGGFGTGGNAELTLASGALSAPSVEVSAEGFGGKGGDNGSDGPGGAAGAGLGGTARVSYLNEGHVIDALTVTADGQGGQAGRYGFGSFDNSGNPIFFYGAGQGGAGGAGTGGVADMLIDVDPSFANLTVSADGIGSAGAISGATGAGGIGTGGIAALNIGFGATTVSRALKVSASGFGGAGGTGLDGAGGAGGNAFGGAATLGLTGSSTLLDAGDISVLAEATGGAGGVSGQNGGAGLNGADGGDAAGGTALFAVTSGAGAITGANLKVSGDATGGAGSMGTAGPVGGAGGSGGDASAGSAILRIDGGRLRYSAALSTPPSYDIRAVGQGGAGAAGGDGTDPGLSGGLGGNGGAGAGGMAGFEAINGDYLLGDIALVANGVGGLGGVGGNGPGGASAGGADGLSSGGTAQLVNGGAAALAAGAQRRMASLSMTANGALGGRALFNDSSTGTGGGLTVTGPLSLSATGVAVAGFTGVDFAAGGNVVQVGGDADFITEGPLHFAFDGGGGLAVTGGLTGASGTEIIVGHAARLAGVNSLSAASIDLATQGFIGLSGDAALNAAGLLTMRALGGDVNLSSGSTAAAGGDLRLFAQGSVLGGGSLSAGGTAAIGLGNGGAGDILLGNLSSGGLLDMADASGNALGGSGIAIGGDFVVSGTMAVGPGSGTLSAASIRIGTLIGDTQALTAPGGVEIGDADLAGLLQVRSVGFARLTGAVNAGSIDIDAGSITSNALTAATGDLLLRSVADLTLTQGQAAGAVVLGSTAGGLTVGDVVAGGGVTLSGTGIAAQRLVSGGAVLLAAGAGDLLVNDLAATGAVTATGRNVSLSGAGDLAFVSVTTSGAATLNAGGLFSLSGAVSGANVTIGSGDIALGTAAQVSATGLLRFNATGSQTAVIGGGDVTTGYSLSAAELSRVSAADLSIGGAGDVIVRDLTVGTAILPGAGVLSIGAAGRLRVEGALAMTGRTGTGGLGLSAGQAIEVIAGAGSVDVRDGNGALGGVLRLSGPAIYVASDAAIADVVAAGSLFAREQRLAQNDGFASEEGVLRAGAMEVDVTEGLYVQNTGISTTFADRRGFTANSLTITTQGRPQIAINGRLALAGGLFATGLETIPLVAVDGLYAAGSKINGCLIGSPAACTGSGATENRELFEVVLDPAASLARVFPLTLVELRDVVTEGYPPLIDEPVTGAGNEDLWERRCGGEGEPACAVP